MNELIKISEIQDYSNIELLAKQLVEGFITGLHKSPYHGFSVEFAEHQLYNSGESTRFIDWKVYAKTDRLYKKRYEEETNLRALLLLDFSSSMFYPVETLSKFKFSAIASAALAYSLQKQRDAVGLCFFSDQVDLLTQVKSTPNHLHNLFLQLQRQFEAKPVQKKTNIAQVIHQIAEQIHKRSLIVIFSDMLENSKDNHEEIFAALQHLKHNKHEVLLFHVLDKKLEEDFKFENRPYIFQDIETGEELKLNPYQVREDYTKAYHAFIHDLKVRCGQFKIDFIDVDVNKSIDQILLPYLIKRSKMK